MFSVDVYFVIALLVICLGSKFVNRKKMLSAQSWKSFWFPSGLAAKTYGRGSIGFILLINMET